MITRIFFSFCILFGLEMTAQTFTNMTGILNGTNSSGRPMVADMNGDHLDDVVRFVNTSLVIDYQQSDGTFVMESYNAGIDNQPTWSVAAGDIDANGYNDLILGSGNRISFVYANDSGTGYEEVNFDEYVFSQRTNFVDIDNDGNLDAFACHDVDTSHPYRNDGSGTLAEDQSLIPTVELGGNYASVWCDFDNDGDVDMYMTKCRQGTSSGDPQRENALYVNDGSGNFEIMTTEYGLWDNEQSWVTIFEDFDNDGDFDVYTVNHTGANKLKENDGTGHYSLVTPGSGIDAGDLNSWACIGADFDNDGHIDILTESFENKQFYHGNGDMTFTAMSMPFDDGALGDLNNDGFIDVYTGGTLWMNDGNDNNYIKVALEGIQSNVNGIGSRIEIYGDFGMKVRECRSGEGFHPGSSLDVFFGLGTFSSIDSMMVHWPSGVISTIEDPAINQLHIIPEGTCFFDAPDIVASGTTDICPGQSLTLTAPEGYNYQWNTGQSSETIIVSEAGNYQVNLSDDQDCLSASNVITVNVIEDETPSIVVDGEVSFCQGESAILISSEALNHTWNNGEEGQFLSVTESGDYSVTIQGQCGTATSESVSIDVIPAPVPEVEDVVVLDAGETTVDAQGENITWYSDAEGTQIIGTGNELVVDVPLEGTTVYASAMAIDEGANEIGGKLDNAGNGGIPSTGGVSFFDVYEPFTLEQVTVYVTVDANTNRTIQLRDENENVIYSMDVVLGPGEQTIDLNWEIPVGEDMGLACTQNNLFRNNDAGTVNYPYPIGTVGEIHSSTWGDTYYYFFYNWRINHGGFSCTSEVVPLNVTVQASSLEEIEGLSGLNMFPNPVQGELQVEWYDEEQREMMVEVRDALGRLVHSEDMGTIVPGEQRMTIDTETWSPGVYSLRWIHEDNSMSRSFIKR